MKGIPFLSRTVVFRNAGTVARSKVNLIIVGSETAAVDHSMTTSAERDQVFFPVISQTPSRLPVMNLKRN